MRITLRQLEYFLATGETGSIRLASERVNISPSAISTAISQLEAELGVTLFLRQQAQCLTLTATGRALMAESRGILSRIKDLKTIARSIDDEVRGLLSVGFFITLAPMLMPEVSRGFTRRYPATRIESHECDQEEIFERLKRAEIDVALTYDLKLPATIAFEPLATLPAHAVLAADHPLAGRPALSLKELAREPMILLDLPHSREYFLSLFLSQGLEPLIAQRTRSPDHLRGLVANGFGYAIANARPRTRLSLDGRELARVPLKGSCRPLRVGLATPEGLARRRQMQAFEVFCRELFADSRVPGMDMGDLPAPPAAGAAAANVVHVAALRRRDAR